MQPRIHQRPIRAYSPSARFAPIHQATVFTKCLPDGDDDDGGGAGGAAYVQALGEYGRLVNRGESGAWWIRANLAIGEEAVASS